jgi:hypothetical protein
MFSNLQTKFAEFQLVLFILQNLIFHHKRAIKENNDIIVKSDCSKALKNDTAANIVFL